MQRFAQLYDDLDSTTRTNQKVAALVHYFREAPPADAAWALFFLTGRRLPRSIKTPMLRQWAADEAHIPALLLDECYDAVGDLSETIALLLPEPTHIEPFALSGLILERILPLRKLHPERQRQLVSQTWRQLTSRERFLFHKMMGGSLRVGVATTLIIRALSQVAGLSQPLMAYRLMGEWQPTVEDYQQILAATNGDGTASVDISKPYPFYLAYSLDAPAETLGPIEDWQIEWKWDGVRAQLIRRQDDILIWSRGEELITQSYPEIVRAADVALPEGTVLDGEILAVALRRHSGLDQPTTTEGDAVAPLPFQQLQRRLERKKVTTRIMNETPVIFLAYDLLEWNGQDQRQLPLRERRQILEQWHQGQTTERFRLSPTLTPASWNDVRVAYQSARARQVEGLMIKRRGSQYGIGRVRGDWWKWNIESFHIDAVLMYVQRASSRQQTTGSEWACTFGVWQGNELVPIAKSSSGLSDAEIQEVDHFIRDNTTDRFGPVHVVKPELVFELAFEGIQVSTRHKAGLVLRFPRIAYWRKDKSARAADTVETIRALLNPTA